MHVRADIERGEALLIDLQARIRAAAGRGEDTDELERARDLLGRALALLRGDPDRYRLPS
jgi:hypothetical protein